MKTISGAPLTLRIVKKMSRSHIRGAGVLTRLFRRLGMLNVISQYQLGNGKFSVPISRIPWDWTDVVTYEQDFIQLFCRALGPLHDATLFDCGADIGTFSARVCSQSKCVSRIVAFEPNQSVHEFLTSNLGALAVRYSMMPKCVSSFHGSGRLQCPPENSTDHARFLVAGEGPIEVTTIDSLRGWDGDVAIKLDLEGGELEALQGAQQTIARCRQCVIGFEASPAVARRTERDPVECLRFLECLRRFHFCVAETGEIPKTSRPLLANGQTEIWNIVAWSHDEELAAAGSANASIALSSLRTE